MPAVDGRRYIHMLRCRRYYCHTRVMLLLFDGAVMPLIWRCCCYAACFFRYGCDTPAIVIISMIDAPPCHVYVSHAGCLLATPDIFMLLLLICYALPRYVR